MPPGSNHHKAMVEARRAELGLPTAAKAGFQDVEFRGPI